MQSADTDLTRGFFWKKNENNSLGFFPFSIIIIPAGGGSGGGGTFKAGKHKKVLR